MPPGYGTAAWVRPPVKCEPLTRTTEVILIPTSYSPMLAWPRHAAGATGGSTRRANVPQGPNWLASIGPPRLDATRDISALSGTTESRRVKHTAIFCAPIAPGQAVGSVSLKTREEPTRPRAKPAGVLTHTARPGTLVGSATRDAPRVAPVWPLASAATLNTPIALAAAQPVSARTSRLISPYESRHRPPARSDAYLAHRNTARTA